MTITDKDIFIDIETYSSVSLAESGAFKYVESPDFRILLFSCSWGMSENVDTFVIEDDLPNHIVDMLSNEEYTLHAHNAQFEITCLAKYLRFDKYFQSTKYLYRWVDDMFLMAYCGFPLSLSEGAKILSHTYSKLEGGKKLIKCFCEPNKTGHRNLSSDFSEEWEQFAEYNKRDVLCAKANIALLPDMNIPEWVSRAWVLDYEINRRGVPIDVEFIENASILCEVYTENELAKVARFGIDNIGSTKQVIEFLRKRGYEVNSLLKSGQDELLEQVEKDEIAKTLLNIRNNISLSSVKKYDSMKACLSSGNRIRGMFQFYGAHTGRAAGRLAQLQNLPKNDFEDVAGVRDSVYRLDYEALNALTGSVKKSLSGLIRTAVHAPEGKTLVISDFASIEARVMAWLANEEWRLEVFRTHGKIYEASAAQMYKMDIADVKKGSVERQKGKCAELAFGFGGGRAAGYRFGMDKLMSDDEIDELVKQWRLSNPAIMKLWSDFDRCAKFAVSNPEEVFTAECGTAFSIVKNKYGQKWLAVKLLSGRHLMYYNPGFTVNKFGSSSVCYEWVNSVTKKWEKSEMYGGKIAENIVQATAWDILEAKKWACNSSTVHTPFVIRELIMHVHDELVSEVYKENAELAVNQMDEIMCLPVEWAKSLPLKADTFSSDFYVK